MQLSAVFSAHFLQLQLVMAYQPVQDFIFNGLPLPMVGALSSHRLRGFSRFPMNDSSWIDQWDDWNWLNVSHGRFELLKFRFIWHDLLLNQSSMIQTWLEDVWTHQALPSSDLAAGTQERRLCALSEAKAYCSVVKGLRNGQLVRRMVGRMVGQMVG